MRCVNLFYVEDIVMASIGTYEDWVSLIDERNESALRAAFLAAVVAWAAVFLLTVV
jgi:hypothetical protein